jgi:hypothetical protein
MTLSNATIDELVDTERYPLAEPGAPAWRAAVSAARRDLATDGCSVLRGFVRAELVDELRSECAALAPRAHYATETVNAYNIALDVELPPEHPARMTMQRGNAFVARDLIPDTAIIHRLYVSEAFQRFVAACFDLAALYELADPLAGLCVNVVTPGKDHPWHFDTNEFTVSMLAQAPEAGGEFEYCPQIRSAADENFDAVRAVLTGAERTRVRRLPLAPGDLQLFAGRYSLHRVCPVDGAAERLSVIFAYSERPGVVGSAERTRQLFGRVLDSHLAPAGGGRVRGDELLD